jgi:hypothetical protein
MQQSTRGINKSVGKGRSRGGMAQSAHEEHGSGKVSTYIRHGVPLAVTKTFTSLWHTCVKCGADEHILGRKFGDD